MVACEATSAEETTRRTSLAESAEVASAPEHADDPPPSPLPVGAIVPFAGGVCPSGWTTVDVDGRFVRVDDGVDPPNDTGGTLVHSHGPHAHWLLGIPPHDHVHSPAYLPVVGFYLTSRIGVRAEHRTYWHEWTDMWGITHGETRQIPDIQAGGPHDHLTEFGQAKGGGWHDHVVFDAAPAGEHWNLPSWHEVVLCQAPTQTMALTDMRLLVDADDCPDTWAFDEDFRGKYLRGPDGDALADEHEVRPAAHDHDNTHHHLSSVSTDNHVHGMALHPSGAGSYATDEGTETILSYDGHVHGAFDSSTAEHSHVLPRHVGRTSTVDAEPSFAEVAICAPADTAPIAQGTLIFVDDVDCPAGWNADVTAFSGRLLRGNTVPRIPLGGSDEHYHDTAHDHGGVATQVPVGGAFTSGHSVVTNPEPVWLSGNTATPNQEPFAASLWEPDHYHERLDFTTHSEPNHPISGGGGLPAASHLPAWRELRLCKKEAP